MAESRALGRAYDPIASQALQLVEKAKEHKVIGIGMCVLKQNSGCFTFAKNIGEELYGAPVVRADGKKRRFLDPLPEATLNYDTVFFAGCPLTAVHVVLDELVNKYNFKEIRYVFEIVLPQNPKEAYSSYFQYNIDQFKKSRTYQFTVLFSTFSKGPYDIGMFPIEFTSQYQVPNDWMGIMLHRRTLDDFALTSASHGKKCIPHAELYFNVYFEKVLEASTHPNHFVKNPVVIAIGIPSQYTKRMIEIARKYTVTIEFRERFPQNDFLQLLSTMATRGGIISLDGACTQTLLQVLSLNVPVMPYHSSEGVCWPHFYNQLMDLVPASYKPSASVMLGLSEEFHLLNDTKKCNKVQNWLHAAISTMQDRFINFKNGTLPKSRTEKTIKRIEGPRLFSSTDKEKERALYETQEKAVQELMKAHFTLKEINERYPLYDLVAKGYLPELKTSSVITRRV